MSHRISLPILQMAVGDQPESGMWMQAGTPAADVRTRNLREGGTREGTLGDGVSGPSLARAGGSRGKDRGPHQGPALGSTEHVQCQLSVSPMALQMYGQLGGHMFCQPHWVHLPARRQEASVFGGFHSTTEPMATRLDRVEGQLA